MASTIKDIRNETGLALSTISKYLNGGNVREENAVKIDAAVKKLDYHPNELARALISILISSWLRFSFRSFDFFIVSPPCRPLGGFCFPGTCRAGVIIKCPNRKNRIL